MFAGKLCRLAAVLVCATAVQFNGSAASQNRNVPPGLALGHLRNGKGAVDSLANRLPSVALEHRMPAEHFRRVLLEDPASRLDDTDRLLFVEPNLDTIKAENAGVVAEPEVSQAAAIPLDQSLLLHSRKGAPRVIYLDFDGHRITGSAWNQSRNGGADIIAPAWDIDGNAAAFGTAELTVIQKVWKRVAEDYAAFNVNVTTEYPGEAALTRSSSSDTQYGMRVLISPISSYFGQAGGIAYVGVFDRVGDYYKPALVFPEQLGNNEKNIGEAAAHECGHTLGLSHDGTTTGSGYYSGQGTGETGWAPIMGVGYYKNLSQWNNGTYANANNKEDDLAKIAGFLGYIGDDYGNAVSTAAVFPEGTQLSAAGVVSGAADADIFKFTTGTGSIQVNVYPADLGPNLDLALSLLDGNGAVVASNNGSDVLGAALNVSVNAGTYYLKVTGTGKGDPLSTGYTSYGSIGAYELTGTVVATTTNPPPAPAETGFVSSVALGTMRNDFSGYVGMKIVIGSQPVTITSLGRMKFNGNSGIHTLKVVRVADGQDVPGASTVVDMRNGTAGQFNYGRLAAPVTLTPGTAYYLFSQETQGADVWAEFDTTITTTTVASVPSAAWGYGPGKFYPWGGAAHTYVPVDFKYTPVAQTEASYITGQTLGTPRNDFTGWVGLHFVVGSNPLTLTQLGRFKLNGNSGTHTVKLVRASDGADVAGASVTLNLAGGTAGQYMFGLLPTPVVLSPGTGYYLMSYETQGGDWWYEYNTQVTNSGVAQHPSAVWGYRQGRWYRWGSQGQSYVPVNFKYVTAQ